MASSNKDHLICPICIDTISHATLLNCGHTFCQFCLEVLFDQHGANLSCPVCRAKTRLTAKGVKGLPPNVIINGLVSDLIKPSRDSAKACRLHKDHEKELFCEECKVHICVRCLVSEHLNHPMKPREEFEREIQEKVDCLMQRGQAKKADMEMIIASTVAPRQEVATAVENLERYIKYAFSTKMRLLKENEASLLGEVRLLLGNYDVIISDLTMPYKQAVEDINRALGVITVDAPESLEADKLASHTMVCNDLDELLNENLEDIDADLVESAKDAVMDTEFHPVRDVQLTLGIIKIKKKVKVLREVQLPCMVEGMTAGSQNTVLVGYGSWLSGYDTYGVTEHNDKCKFKEGERVEAIRLDDGSDDDDDDELPIIFDDEIPIIGVQSIEEEDYREVWDIAKLSSGELAISHGTHSVAIYLDRPTHSKYQCTNVAYACQICSDQANCVYVVNGKPDVAIFQVGRTVNSQRIIRTNELCPRQVSVTSNGVIIVSTCDITPSTVTVFDKNGTVGSSLKGTDDKECLYAAVDSRDQVLIARVRQGSTILKMSTYILQGYELKEKVKFDEVELPLEMHSSLGSLCHLVSLTPELFAFAHYDSLVFFKVPVEEAPVYWVPV
ncbi:E3 ubiquitin-protein ligase TRIM35-like [Lytechinus variegatus]|uniref:E3 ubiquitin-protein ligase TRIM35-like n=1 Tax=Lytechinus variegatus TaxID=7654 RepID=UPI001BB250EC|nr:E3 ubiquitin-protein ligase TRIM35-like [Lytechinus variegatus]